MRVEDRERLINEYLDRDLLPEDVHRVESLLRHDAEFAADVERQRALLARAATLPREINAPASAWSNIVTRIDEEKVVKAEFGTRRATAWPRHMALVAAAIALMVVSSGVTILVLRGDSGDPATSPAAVIAQTAVDIEAAYALTIDELRLLMDARRNLLDPEIVGSIEASLAAIDRAIHDATDALAATPESQLVLHQLAGAYRSKVDVLIRAAQLATEI